MTHSFDGYNHLIRLERGERLAQALEQFVAETKVEGAWLSGLGAASEVELGFYNLSSKTYKWRTFGNMMEVVSLTGNIAFDESSKLGGHVKDLVAGGTVEIFVHRSYQPMHRKRDEATGLELLDLR